jgi:GntR family transcriptional regulator
MPTETTPRYLEIADYLRRLVATARAGDRLPSDAELCERFRVSRMTARQAVQVLSNERLLTRRRGDGTYVAARTAARTLGSPLSFTESMRRRGLRASSRVLAAGWGEATEDDCDALGLGPGERVVRLERLRLADGRPMAIERASIAPSLGAVLGGDLERGSLHDAFERLGHQPIQAEARVSARRATSGERRVLELGPGGVVLVERRIISDQRGTPLEHTETVYAAERYEFEAILRGDGEPRPDPPSDPMPPDE